MSSDKYIDNKSKVEIKYSEGHSFWVAPHNVTSHSGWCPECWKESSEGRSEKVCRNIIEAIFKNKFPKFYPEWLANDKGYQLELDGYNRELGMAFEYQGRQHYQYVPFFHESEEQFLHNLGNDQTKRDL